MILIIFILTLPFYHTYVCKDLLHKKLAYLTLKSKEYDLVQAQPVQTHKFSSIFIETGKDLSPHSHTPARTSLLLRCLFFKAFSSRSSITALNSSKSTSPVSNQSNASISWRNTGCPKKTHFQKSTMCWRIGWPITVLYNSTS